MHRENKEEKEVVIAYASRPLNDVEKNWSTIEKEAYAIVHAVKQFYPYLYEKRFQVLSDHKTLRELLRKKETSAKLARWALCMQDYDIAIDYRAGKVNQNADCLSRIPETDGATTTQPEVTPVINALTKLRFAEEQEKDQYCKSARTKYEEAKRIKEELLNDIEIEMKTLKENNKINESPRDGDEGYLLEDINIDDDEEVIELDNGLLGTTAGRILLPKSLKEKILKRFHDSPYAGHLGIKKTAARI
jgi:hypothetical protein